MTAKYLDRGLVVLALQVRRDPDILAENILYWLQSLRPTFPVFRLGWDPEWPTRTLPWALVFDHQGREVFAGKPEFLEPVIEKALAAAPDHVIGGPYETHRALADSIVADRMQLGTHLAQLRAEEAPDPELLAMIEAAEHWFERQVARIEQDLYGVVEQAAAWDALATAYAGDRLGERAAKERDALRSRPTFKAEEAADLALRAALTTLHRCPPRGGYFPYHFTKINYTLIDDPAWVASRVRTLTEFRLELQRLVASYPDTHAAEEAAGLLFMHDVPLISAEAAGERVECAERLLAAGPRPAELYEAYLLLVEVREGGTRAVEIPARAALLLATLERDRADDLQKAQAEVRALREEAELLQREVQVGGSLLSREKADRIITRLTELAAQSGSDTVLAGRIAAYVAELTKSFDGAPRVGVRLDVRFPGPGVRIALVDPDTGASLAGLVPGDVVLKLGGTELSGPNDFTKAIGDKKPGQTLTVEVLRADGEVVPLEIKLGRRLP